MNSLQGPNAVQHASSFFLILVVDDFELWRRSVCSMLEDQTELRVVGEAEDGGKLFKWRRL